jgi:RNA 2',3'-cyclic 3'-phosphodiesterase
VRLFIAVWPPEDVIELLAGLPRLDLDKVRWTSRPQWHVTLRFLGEVASGEVHPLVGSLVAIAGSAPARAVLGPATAWFPGRRVLQVPVAGLDALEDRVADAIGSRAPGDPFRGHLTLARARGRQRVEPADAGALAGIPVSAEWAVTEVSLVMSSPQADGAGHGARHGPRYTDLVSFELGT